YRSLQFYYSGHLQDLQQRDYPRIGYDPAEKHAGRQSLRIGYDGGKPANVWSRQTLPGKPTALGVWVKGNETPDELFVSFEDHINFSLPAWQRNANFSEAKVCTLDFAGWRRFTVPVLGAGLQSTGSKGSTTAIDAPVKILAFSVRTTVAKGQEAGDPRQVWLDDLSVQTQAAEDGRLSLELGSNTADGDLTDAASLFVSLGNGRGVDLGRGRLSLAARDAEGRPVWTHTLDLPAQAGQFTSVEVPLKELAGKPVDGPIDVDVTFADATVPGARIAGRQTWKRALQAAVVHDFEQRETYSGYQPGAVTTSRATVVEGGANGSPRALALSVVPGQTGNSVLLHPAMPGVLDRVELMIHGGSRPVTLQPWLIDAAVTGVWLRKHNLFWCDPITVDWQGWRKVTIRCPPVPVGYSEKSRPFLFEPAYPLNLAFDARTDGDGPVEVRFDDVRAVTHLPRDAWHSVEIEYPDESRVLAPGSPLRAIVTNFGREAATFDVAFRLRHAQGFIAREGSLPLKIEPGERRHVTLIDGLAAGVYELEVAGIGPQPLRGPLVVLPAERFFGPTPETVLADPLALRRKLGLTNERIYLDWDNVEPAPYVRHFTWFDQEAGKRLAVPDSLTLDPVVGFSADWAGPEARDALAKGVYTRYIPNILQVPERLIDWSLFVRELQREYRGRFDRWVFWENPDLDQAPQNIPPERYRPLLEIFHRWVKLYNPRSRVIAGGFNFDKALAYLKKISDPHTLPFDEIAMQVNLGELSPEKADMEGFLDDLNDLLRLRETRRTVAITELDWGIGPLVSPVEQAAYHSRAALLLHSRAAAAHHFQLVNTGFSLDGYGVFYRLPYGNSGDLQAFKPSYVPKPAAFALMETRGFLAQWQYVTSVALADRSLDDERAYVYRNGQQRLAAVVWRAVPGERVYRVPAAWSGAEVRDAFNMPADVTAGLRVTPLPLFVTLPAGYRLEDLLEDLRRLPAADGSHPVWLDLHLAADDSRARCRYQAQGQLTLAEHAGQLPGSRTVREPFVQGIRQEQFTFVAPEAGTALLRRRWYFDGTGQVLHVSINGGAEQRWNLGPGQDNAPGVRETMFVLSGCRAGENVVSVRSDAPVNASGYRIEPLAGGEVPLVRLGAINARQSRGRFLNHANASGAPFSIGKTTYDDGIGTHATSFIEYPLAGQFERFEATCGIDGSTEGRGSVVFRVYVDGKLRADTGVVNGFDAAKSLTVDGLGAADRLILSVTDAGDGDRHDLANWVDGKLVLTSGAKPGTPAEK
ncbi:MAG: NPCBM/NEW2 domain-containing protein, partial [Planctomycetia bacterium]